MWNLLAGRFGMHALSAMNILADAAAAAQKAAAPAADAGAVDGYHAPWDKWLSVYSWEIAVRAIVSLALLLILAAILLRLFRRVLTKYQLQRASVVAAVSIIVYITILVWHPLLMVDSRDIIAITIHKLFLAIILGVSIRFVDRLVILPVLTRISGGPPSRFIHQIVAFVLTGFVIAFYCSWAFDAPIASLLTGSAVISIVLGLALQETLGNFFSGMVLQASVPFATGDWIQVGSVEGRVVEMTWRAVTLLTRMNNYVLIPNSTVAKEQIVNYHAPTVSTATTVSVGVDYSIPPNDVKRALIAAAKDTPGVLENPPPGAALASFDDSSIGYKVVFWIDQPEMHGAVEQAVRVNVWYRLNQAGYGIPFPIRTVEWTDLDKKKAQLAQESTARRIDAIRRSPIFGEMSPQLQQQLAAETRDYAMAAGQVFFRQGDVGDSLFILQSGKISITVLGDAGQQLDVTEFEAPAVFGEVSAVTGHPRAATYRAKTDVTVIEVDRTHLQSLFSADPQFMQHLSNVVAQRQKEREELLKKAGAAGASQTPHTEPHTVLDRMKRMFSVFQR